MIFTFSVKQHLQKISESRSWADLLVMEEDGETVYSSFEQKEDKWRQEQSDELVKEAAGKYQVCVLMDQEMLLQRLFPKILAIVAVAILVLGTSILCIAVYIRRLTGRVDVILNGMEEVETGNLQVRLDINRSGGDELDTIADHFNDMCAKLEEYIQKSYTAEIEKKNAQMQALQSQINPHFLYNTLECIRGQALLDDNIEIAKMVEALSSFFRYSISKKGNLVTLRDELANTENYMLIQRYRFNNRFSMEIIIDEEDEVAYDFLVPRLIIQPVIENAIFHGLEERMEGGIVSIEVIVTDLDMIITISDNGKGIDCAELEELNNRMNANDMELEDKNNQINTGIALPNINRRIRLLFGEEYGVNVYSTLGKGTDVEIIIPANYKREEHENEERAFEN